MAVTWDQLPLPFDDVLAPPACRLARSPLAPFASCPHCDGDMRAEHAHFKCVSCGWRDSCCD